MEASLVRAHSKGHILARQLVVEDLPCGARSEKWLVRVLPDSLFAYQSICLRYEKSETLSCAQRSVVGVGMPGDGTQGCRLWRVALHHTWSLAVAGGLGLARDQLGI